MRAQSSDHCRFVVIDHTKSELANGVSRVKQGSVGLDSVLRSFFRRNYHQRK